MHVRVNGDPSEIFFYLCVESCGTRTSVQLPVVLTPVKVMHNFFEFVVFFSVLDPPARHGLLLQSTRFSSRPEERRSVFKWDMRRGTHRPVKSKMTSKMKPFIVLIA